MSSHRGGIHTSNDHGPYGFLIPAGARTVVALTNYGGPASWAKITDAGTGAVLVYKVSGGELGQAYLPDHTPNPAGVLGAPTPGPVAYLAPCTVIAHTAATGNALTYICTPATPGMITQGQIIVEPYPQGYKVLQVSLRASQAIQLKAILNSLTPARSAVGSPGSDLRLTEHSRSGAEYSMHPTGDMHACVTP